MKKILIASMLSGLLLLSNESNAQIASNFQSTASVNGFCSINIQNINFGQINFEARTDATGSMNVLCSRDLNYRIAINQGSNFTLDWKRLKGATRGDILGYKLYSGPTYNSSVEWEENVNKSFKGTGEEVNMTLYARIPSLSASWRTPDDYSDTLTVTLTY